MSCGCKQWPGRLALVVQASITVDERRGGEHASSGHKRNGLSTIITRHQLPLNGITN